MWRDGLRRVADTEVDDIVGVGVILEVLATATTDLGEEITGLEFGKIGIAFDSSRHCYFGGCCIVVRWEWVREGSRGDEGVARTSGGEGAD